MGRIDQDSSSLQAPSRPELAATLHDSRSVVLEKWTNRVRERIRSAQGQDKTTLQDNLVIFLDNLERLLRTRNPRTERASDGNVCASHGRQRAQLGKFTVDELISEYQLLESVILEELGKDQIIGPDARALIRKTVDHALNDTIIAFVQWKRPLSEQTETFPLITLLQRFAAVAAVAAICISIWVMLGWAFDVTVMKSLSEGLTTTKFNTAVVILLLGFTLWLQKRELLHNQSLWTSRVLATLAATICVVTLLEYVMNVTWIDELLVQSPGELVHPGRPGALSSVAFLLTSVALLMLDLKRRFGIPGAHTFATLGMLIGIWSLAGYVLSTASVGGPTSFVRMGVYTTAALCLVNTGILCSRPDQGLMKIVTEPLPGSAALRLLLPAAVLIPLFLAWLGTFSTQHLDTRLIPTATTVTLALVIFFSLAFWFTARKLNRVTLAQREILKSTAEVIDQRDRSLGIVKELREEGDFRDNFVAMLSHDLRSPLSTLKTAAQMGLRYPDQNQIHAKFFSRILGGVDRIDRMINDLLDANRIRSGDPLPLEKSWIDLSEVVRETVEELSFSYGDRFQIQVPDRLEGCWSRDGLRRVLENLCTNALKYGRSESQVRVSLRTLGSKVEMSVHNEGPAIPPEDQTRIFEPYHRTSLAESGQKPGWGVGLALVQGIARSHEGEVSVQSSNETGTTFTVTLPLSSKAVTNCR